MDNLVIVKRPDNRLELSNAVEIMSHVACVVDNLRHTYNHDIVDDEEFKKLKLDRADLNAKIKEIARKRIDTNVEILGLFNGQVKAIEDVLKTTEKILKKRVDDYVAKKTAKDTVEVSLHTLTVQCVDAQKLEQVKKYAAELGCQVSEVK